MTKINDTYRDAVLIAIGARKIGTSDLQHRLRIGYEEARALFMQMEEDKILDVSSGPVTKDVLLSSIDQFDDLH